MPFKGSVTALLKDPGQSGRTLGGNQRTEGAAGVKKVWISMTGDEKLQKLCVSVYSGSTFQGVRDKQLALRTCLLGGAPTFCLVLLSHPRPSVPVLAVPAPIRRALGL